MILTVLAVLALTDQPVVTADRGQGHVPAPTAAEETVAPSLTTPSITAPRAMTTDEQIAAWIGASPAAPMDVGGGPVPYDAPFDTERRMRGQVSAAIGSHDYRSFGVGVSIPLGESGFADLHYSESKGGHGAWDPYYYGDPRHDRYDFGYGLRSGAAFGLDAWDTRGARLNPDRPWRSGVTTAPDGPRW